MYSFQNIGGEKDCGQTANNKKKYIMLWAECGKKKVSLSVSLSLSLSLSLSHQSLSTDIRLHVADISFTYDAFYFIIDFAIYNNSMK
jgi:hypothetical protein